MKIVLFIILLITPFIAFTQNKKIHFISATSREVGITAATNGNATALAIHGNQYWGFGKKNKNFKIGFGVRFTSSFGNSSLLYITAPAKFTSGKTGPGVFFADQIPQNIDTLSLNATQVNSLNLLIALRYDFAKKWGVEFNIDFAGVSFGGKKNATLLYGDQTHATHISSAKPTVGNLLLVSDNDIGSLNSEFMISYKINIKIKLKTGLVFLFNEYELDKPVNYTNSLGTFVDVKTYRTKMYMFGIGANMAF